MKIPEQKLEQIKNQYNEFKQTSSYIERKEQLKFADFARSILKQIIQKDDISNDDLTALIQIFGHGSRTENVKKYIKSLNLEQSYSESFLNKYLEIEQTGFTGRGKSAIRGLTNDQLQAVHYFLINVSKADSEESIRQIVSDFEKQDIPQVKYGVYSPWLYYLHPTICPLVAGPVKNYLHDLGWNTESYLDAWDLLKQINEVINEDDYGFLDQFIWDNKADSDHPIYWLFITPKDYEDGELWKYCKRNSIAAMQYQYESEPQNLVTKNLRLINKIAEGDKVVVYLNDKTVGGIGEVIQPFYEDVSYDNGFDGHLGQRIGLRWLTDEFEKSIEPIWKELSLKKKNLSLQTIHEISEDDYEKIANFFVQTNHNKHELNPLIKKKQVILYGPPGTGKTYNTKQIALQVINNN